MTLCYDRIHTNRRDLPASEMQYHLAMQVIPGMDLSLESTRTL